MGQERDTRDKMLLQTVADCCPLEAGVMTLTFST